MPIKKLELPAFDHQLITQNGKPYIFDILRKKYVYLTPEEWVRQHMVHYLIHYRGYRPTFMNVESSIEKYGRADLLIYDTKYKPYMLVECKAPTEVLNFKIINQVGRYNSSVQFPVITITNGIKHFCFQKKESNYEVLKEIPYLSEFKTI